MTVNMRDVPKLHRNVSRLPILFLFYGVSPIAFTFVLILQKLGVKIIKVTNMLSELILAITPELIAYSTFQSEMYICGNSTENAALLIQLLQLSVMTVRDH